MFYIDWYGIDWYGLAPFASCLLTSAFCLLPSAPHFCLFTAFSPPFYCLFFPSNSSNSSSRHSMVEL
ncbi:MAG: hypothetical protein EA364_12340 [Balneolaceae bacterium]|nr:MAG: hypothetical protein EA364_12340 [Balneolaceae bacterium]